MQIMYIIVVYISIKKIIETNNYFGFWKINIYCFLMSRVNMQVLYCLKYPLD